MRGMLVAALAAVAVGGCAAPQASPDKRTPVQLTAEQRNAVLTEMRTMLASVSGVLAAAARSDTAGIRSAAAASGMAASADTVLERLLPREWMAIAVQTHQGFDGLAAAAGAGRDQAVLRLGGITATCVSCHAMYRLAVR